jgi:hypothetical protein
MMASGRSVRTIYRDVSVSSFITSANPPSKIICYALRMDQPPHYEPRPGSPGNTVPPDQLVRQLNAGYTSTVHLQISRKGESRRADSNRFPAHYE